MSLRSRHPSAGWLVHMDLNSRFISTRVASFQGLLFFFRIVECFNAKRRRFLYSVTYEGKVGPFPCIF